MMQSKLPAESEKTARIRITLNGEEVDVSFAPYKTLLEVLREDLNHTGTKHGCELGECGACAVILDGEPVLSCLVLALECDGRNVITIEGLASDGELHPVQEAFAKLGGSQCGYCTPGMIITAVDIVRRKGHELDDRTIREELEGNICRCTGYHNIVKAIAAGARAMQGGGAATKAAE